MAIKSPKPEPNPTPDMAWNIVGFLNLIGIVLVLIGAYQKQSTLPDRRPTPPSLEHLR